MKLQVLSDNLKLHKSLESEHGLCIYLETETLKILLDTGASDKFIRNAEKAEIHIDEIDYVFISHGHADHTGGLLDFLKQNSKAKIILSPNVLSQQFFSTRKELKNISSDQELINYKDRFIFVENDLKIDEEISVFSCNEMNFNSPKANKFLMIENKSGMIPDNFNHELIFCFGNEELLVFTGCAHKGILNIIDTVTKKSGKKILKLIGGFHLIDSTESQQYETEQEIKDIALKLKNEYPDTQFFTGHCTGEKNYRILKKEMGNQLSLFYTGFTLICSNIKHPDSCYVV